jgi:hypothetical protein
MQKGAWREAPAQQISRGTQIRTFDRYFLSLVSFFSQKNIFRVPAEDYSSLETFLTGLTTANGLAVLPACL